MATENDTIVKLPEEIKACKVDEVVEAEKLSAKIGEHNVLVTRIKNRFYAVENKCSKDGAKLSDGDINIKEAEVKCPKHNGSFQLSTGLHRGDELCSPIHVFLGHVKNGHYYIDTIPKELPFVEGINL